MQATSAKYPLSGVGMQSSDGINLLPNLEKLSRIQALVRSLHPLRTTSYNNSLFIYQGLEDC